MLIIYLLSVTVMVREIVLVCSIVRVTCSTVVFVTVCGWHIGVGKGVQRCVFVQAKSLLVLVGKSLDGLVTFVVCVPIESVCKPS